MGKAKRKQRPQPPRWFGLDTDNCWFCKSRNNCNQCRLLKQFRKKREYGKDKVSEKME